METPYTKMTGYQHPGFEDEAGSNDSANQRIVLDAKNTNEMNRGYVCRCLGPCGKQTLQHKPSDGLCPSCGSYCAPATFASRRQTRELAEKCWTVVDSNSLAHAIRELGLVPMAVVGDLESDLHKIARGRNDDYRRSHLFAHRHIVDRPGLANGDLKSMGALSRALCRDTTVPKFVEHRTDNLQGSSAYLSKRNLSLERTDDNYEGCQCAPNCIVIFILHLA